MTDKEHKVITEYGEEAIDAYVNLYGELDTDKFEESYQGKYSSDVEFAREIASQLGEISDDLTWPHYCIDWEWAARELMIDSSEENGYYFREL